VLLSPLLPTSTGRAAITAPLALAVADARRLGDRQPAAAVLGLAAWIGAGPLLFLFLSGSSTCLLAWGLLPDATRQQFDWINWTLAALPLGVVMGVGGLVMLFAVLRPSQTLPAARGHVQVQLSVLGPPSRRELAMLGVLLLTVCGWITAPALHVEIGVIAILGLLGAVISGNLNRQAMRELDWDYLIFYGVVLSLARVSSELGLDRLVGTAIGARLAESSSGALALVLGVAVSSVLVRLVLGVDQAVLLLCLAFVPAAVHLGINPWVAVVTILAATCSWLVPAQTSNYLAAYSASEGRLFSPSQARRAAVGYLVVMAAGLTVSVPYWHFLGLL
jgi:di/tricarboxylate transporter